MKDCSGSFLLLLLLLLQSDFTPLGWTTARLGTGATCSSALQDLVESGLSVVPALDYGLLDGVLRHGLPHDVEDVVETGVEASQVLTGEAGGVIN